MNEYLPQKPFDLYELHLICLVASSGNFTRAASEAGLTQSAVTRQIQGVEERLGIRLFERTTRRVLLTEAGRLLIAESRRITGDVDTLIHRLREEFGGAPREVRIGLSRSIGLSYYPGFLFANRTKHPHLATRIWQDASSTLLQHLEEGKLDVAIVSRPARFAPFCRVVHRFQDEFVLITPASEPEPAGSHHKPAKLRPWAERQTWILIHEETSTGTQLRRWMAKHQLTVSATMQADNFDLIINLVSLGYGTSFVPHRALALYTQKKRFRRIQLQERFSRELVVLVRKHPPTPKHIVDFVENILF